MQVLTVSSPSALTRADVSAPLKCKPPSYGPSVDEYCVRQPVNDVICTYCQAINLLIWLMMGIGNVDDYSSIL
jgi:hypothetical protein